MKESKAMKEYKGYSIKKVGEYYEIISKDGKWMKNATTISNAKEKIDLLVRQIH